MVKTSNYEIYFKLIKSIPKFCEKINLHAISFTANQTINDFDAFIVL